MDTLNNKLKALNIEDFIWIVYIGIIILSFYSNSLERKYYLSNDLICKKKYQNPHPLKLIMHLQVYHYQ